MPFSMIAGKKTAPLAGLIRKLAFNDARAPSSVQAIRLFNTNGMLEVEALDGKSNLGRGSDRRVAWGVFDISSRMRNADFISAVGEGPLSKRSEWYEDEDENRLELQFDMPGLGKEHVNLRVNWNILIVKGDGEEEKGEEEGRDRRYRRIIELIDGHRYKMNEIEAEMKNGVLKIVVPKVKDGWKDVSQINVK